MSNDDDEPGLFDDDYVPSRALPTPFTEKSEEQIKQMDQRWRSKTPRKRANKNSPENLVKAKLEKYMDSKGIKWTRVNSGTIVIEGRTIQMGAPGTSDYIGCAPIDVGSFVIGVFIAVEAKAGKNKPTELQLKFLARIRAAGGIAVVAYTPLDIDRAIDEMREQIISALRRMVNLAKDQK